MKRLFQVVRIERGVVEIDVPDEMCKTSIKELAINKEQNGNLIWGDQEIIDVIDMEAGVSIK